MAFSIFSKKSLSSLSCVATLRSRCSLLRARPSLRTAGCGRECGLRERTNPDTTRGQQEYSPETDGVGRARGYLNSLVALVLTCLPCFSFASRVVADEVTLAGFFVA